METPIDKEIDDDYLEVILASMMLCMEKDKTCGLQKLGSSLMTSLSLSFPTPVLNRL